MRNLPSPAIVVTGGVGFIGTHLVNRLLQQSDVKRVMVIDKRVHDVLSRLVERNHSDRVVLVCRDLAGASDLTDLLSGAELVYHLAAETHVETSLRSPELFINANILATLRLLQAARAVRFRLIFTSSSEVYGAAANGPLSEQSPLEPRSPYAATKVAADRLISAYVHSYGIDASIVRLFNTYGPAQQFEKLIPMFVCSALCGYSLPMQGSGRASRDWSFVKDTVERLIRLRTVEPEDQVLNLGSGVCRSVGMIAKLIEGLLPNHNVSISRLPDRLGQVVAQRASTEIVDRLLGGITTSFEEGLSNTLRWYRDRQRLWQPAFEKFRNKVLRNLEGRRKD